MFPYLPHIDKDREEMLESIGVNNIEDLFSDIDPELRINEGLNLPAQKSELELLKHMEDLASKNQSEVLSFTGGGAYDHYIPSIVPYLTSRQEFSTAYTPYQPEISQGTLQAIYEYQSMICMLTGLDASNASHYDGATATAEAIMMACGDKRRTKCIISESMNDQVVKVAETYLKFKGIEIIKIATVDGVTNVDELREVMNSEIGCVVVQSPNKYGIIEELSEIEKITHDNKGYLIMNANPISLSVLKSPKEWGVDIAVGEGQPLGNSLNYGGSYFGYMACAKKLMRKLPGRIVGETKDIDGKRGYVLTLQGREQHIRREKATSNITSNQALNALAGTIYMATMGAEGLKEVAIQSMKNARYLADELEKKGVGKVVFKQPYYNEFLFKVNDTKNFIASLINKGIVPGIDFSNNVENSILISTTEKHTKEDLDRLINEMEGMK